MKALKAYNTEAITRFHQRKMHNTEIVETPQDDPPGPPVPENDLPDLPESDLDIPDDPILDFVNSQCHSSEDLDQTLQAYQAYEVPCPKVVEFWGLPPLILFFNMSIGWFGRFALSTECYRTRKLGYKNLNWPRCSAWVTESLVLTDGGFCQKQTLYILDYVKLVSL